jgi:hypothetical protein
MVEQIFHVGDRVKASVSTAFIQEGSEGVVCAWYQFMPEAYDVQFDGQPKSWMMWDDELNPMTEAEAPSA